MKERKPGHWWDHFWHIVTGCEKCGPACANCWATGFAWTKSHHPNIKISLPFKGTAYDSKTWTGHINHNEAQLDQPGKWKAGEIVFVAPTGDLALASPAFIQKVYHAMAQWYCDMTFIVVTKRPALLLESLKNYFPETPHNIWHLASIWDQESTDRLVPELLRFREYGDWPVLGVSAEPLLGPINLLRVESSTHGWINALDGFSQYVSRGPVLDWVIVGGESGPKARPMHPDWAGELRDQCQAAGVPFFFKQWGEWQAADEVKICRGGLRYIDDLWMRRVGKSFAGRLLDGQVWEQFPEVTR